MALALTALGIPAVSGAAGITTPWTRTSSFPDDSYAGYPPNNCLSSHNGALGDDGRIWLFSGFTCWAHNENVIVGGPQGWGFAYPDFQQEPNWASATAQYGPHIFKVGGSTGSGQASLIWRVTPGQGSYGSDYDMAVAGHLPVGIESPGAVVSSGWMYVVGGRDYNGTIGSAVLAAPVTSGGTIGTFRQVATLPAANSGMSTLVIRGRLYVIGGLSAKVIYATLGSNGAVGAWQSAPDLPERTPASVVAIGDDLYTIGGETDTGSSDRVRFASISPTTGAVGAWQTDPQHLPEARPGSVAVVMNDGKIVVTGGNGSGSTDAIYASTNSVKSDTELLDQYTPQLNYSINETYRSDSAATITDNCVWDTAANRLVQTNYLMVGRKKQAASCGTQLRTNVLSLGYLGSYAASATDYIDEDNDYAEAAQRLHADPAYRNKIYGRIKDYGAQGKILQYWFFSYYNPYSVVGVGAHEGDWEMAQVHLNLAQAPVKATYSQHGDGEQCTWGQVEKATSGRPMVYVGEGSHASYFRPGPDGSQNSIEPSDHVIPVTETIADSTGWRKWPGRWGASDGSNGGTASPNGPGWGGNALKWNDPAAWSTGSNIKPCTVAAVSASRKRRGLRHDARSGNPIVKARRHGRHFTLHYKFRSWAKRRSRRPWVLLTTSDPRGYRYPPLTLRSRVRRRSGTVRQPLGLGRGQRIYVGVIRRDGSRTQLMGVRPF